MRPGTAVIAGGKIAASKNWAIYTHWAAVVQADPEFWHWYRPVEVEQNEPAAPLVGGLVEQAEMPPPPPFGGTYVPLAFTRGVQFVVRVAEHCGNSEAGTGG